MGDTFVAKAAVVKVTVGPATGNRVARIIRSGGLIPEGVDSDQLARLRERGLIAETSSSTSTASSSEPLTEPPAKSAAKDVWVAWAVQNGADEAEAKKAKKDDLIATYGDVTQEPGSGGGDAGDQA